MVLLDEEKIAELRRIERLAGAPNILSNFVRNLESGVTKFGEAFSQCVACGDGRAAERIAHTLKGHCLQLGVQGLADLFTEIERETKAGRYAEAQRQFENAAPLIAESLNALKQA